MNRNQKLVRQFHESFELTINDKPTLPSAKDAELRRNLINEEAEEFSQASEAGDIVGVADALADLLYVVYGAANAYGIDMEPIFEEVQRSNMTKLWSADELDSMGSFPSKTKEKYVGNGKFLVKRVEDGKVMKSPDYSPADIAGELEKLRGS